MNGTHGNLAYQEEPRTEIIGGRVVMLAAPSMSHVFIAADIFRIFDAYLDGKPCTAIPDSAAVFLEEGEEYQPDVMVVCDPAKIRNKGVFGAPDLVVEVLSPSTGRYDRGHKMQVYERGGVREYWIVDPVSRTIDQYVLTDGRLILRDEYRQYTAEEWEDLDEKERAAAVKEFRCSLFDDLVISVERVFRRARAF